MRKNPRVCVVPYGVKIDRKACSCSQLAPHIHVSETRAEPSIKSGELRQIKGAVYQFTQRANERGEWIPMPSGRYGPLVLQLQ